MRESISWTISTVMGSFDGQVEISIKETISMMKDMDMVKCTGLMEVFTRDNGRKGYNTGMEKCTFLMARRKLEYLRITSLKEQLINQNFPTKTFLKQVVEFNENNQYPDQLPK